VNALHRARQSRSVRTSGCVLISATLAASFIGPIGDARAESNASVFNLVADASAVWVESTTTACRSPAPLGPAR